MSHLTLATRSEIENGLRHGDSCGAIARRLKVARTTIVREIQKHAVASDKGAKGRVTNRCIHRSECTQMPSRVQPLQTYGGRDSDWQTISSKSGQTSL